VNRSLEETYLPKAIFGMLCISVTLMTIKSNICEYYIKCICYVCCFLTVGLTQDAQNVMKFIRVLENRYASHCC
jgi:hypothetical protein